MSLFVELHQWGRFVSSLKATFLVLVPKKGGAEDFRSISLVEACISVLVNHLKKVLPKMISKAQNAFVEGKQIPVETIVANEAVDSFIRS